MDIFTWSQNRFFLQTPLYNNMREGKQYDNYLFILNGFEDLIYICDSIKVTPAILFGVWLKFIKI